MSRGVLDALASDPGNGGAESARVADAFAEQDAERRAWLDQAVRQSGWSREERRIPKGCPECGSKAKHIRGCTQAKQAACRCGHPIDLHRGIVCHGKTATGLRCRCSGCWRRTGEGRAA